MTVAQGSFVPWQHEAAFGIKGQPALVIRDGEDSLHLRGFIDRVDRDPAGRVRIIDYKTSSPYDFTAKSVQEGKRLQLPLYALAARDALGLGEPVDGFYWHVRHAKASAFTLGAFPGGPAAAMQVATAKAWEAVRGARGGHFVPRPPDNGCPKYCPAAGFCWHYRAGFGG
jgi:RecB family exonuclease